MRTKLAEGNNIVAGKDILSGDAKSASADLLGEDVVDGEVVADAEEVAELDVLLPQQALPAGDLSHLGQDLKQAKNYKLSRSL